MVVFLLKMNLSFLNMKKKFMKSGLPTGFMLATFATIIWSWNYIIARGLHDAISPSSLAFYRWLVASVVLAPIALKKSLREYTVIKRNTKYIVTTAFFGVTVFNTLIYLAGRTTEAINLSLIAISSPIFIVIFSLIVFNEKINIKKITGISVTIAGILILLTRGDISVLLNISFAAGDLWMLIAAITFAFYSIMVKKKPRELSRTSFLFSTFTAGLFFLLPLYILDLILYPFPSFNAELIISILYIGVFASVAAFFLWNRSIEIIGPSNAGLIYYTLPLFSTLWAIFFLNETAEAVHFISMTMILAGIIIAGDNDKKLTNMPPD
jgi:drug/metabolite transporter (DMT)-like permease